MKFFITCVLWLSLSLAALAVDRADLDFRLCKLTGKFDTMQSKSDKRIPVEKLRKAKGIVLLDRTKAGFLFAYQGGSGAVMMRDPKSNQWGPAAFLKASEASLGFQIGGQQSFIVILLMNTNAIQMVTQGDFKFGGEASGTAGNESGGAEGTLDKIEPLVLIYSDREGLYGGAAIKGDAISPDTDANLAYYGQYLTTGEILLERKVKPTQPAIDLAKRIEQFSK
jgi:lipid-binding SYLF domain-containing protein